MKLIHISDRHPRMPFTCGVMRVPIIDTIRNNDKKLLYISEEQCGFRLDSISKYTDNLKYKRNNAAYLRWRTLKGRSKSY